MTKTIEAPTPGVFWQRSAPEAPEYAQSGDALRAGSQVGLIEVMKMFLDITVVEDCTFVSYIVANGAIVAAGDAVAEVETAE
jgi:biotin carboxyl carrier protein